MSLIEFVDISIRQVENYIANQKNCFLRKTWVETVNSINWSTLATKVFIVSGTSKCFL